MIREFDAADAVGVADVVVAAAAFVVVFAVESFVVVAVAKIEY